jgi:transposase
VLRFSTKCRDRYRYNLIAAIGSNGDAQHVISDAKTNGAVFARFVDSLNFPPGAVLLMDNARFHDCQATRAALGRKGYVAMFVPPYAAPDYNPIEMMFGIVKQRFYELRHTSSFDVTTVDETLDQCTRLAILPSSGNVLRCFHHTARVVSASLASFRSSSGVSSTLLRRGFEHVAALYPRVQVALVFSRIQRHKDANNTSISQACGAPQGAKKMRLGDDSRLPVRLRDQAGARPSNPRRRA